MIRAVQACEGPAVTGPREDVKSKNTVGESAKNASFPQAPTICHWSDNSGTWALTVLDCPFCHGRHWHGGRNGSVPILGTRVAHCGTSPAGAYELRLIDVPHWAADMGVSEVAVLEAIGQLKTALAMDRRFRLRPGTASTLMLDAMRAPE